MSDITTALAGATFDGLVRVIEAPVQGMITLRGDLASEDMVRAVKAATGLAIPQQRAMTTGSGVSCLWMSPDELLILCDYAKAPDMAAQITDSLGAAHHLCAVVSDARAVFAVTGEAVREVLGKLAPVDLSPDVFGLGEVKRTRLAQVAAAFWLVDEDAAQVVCFRSTAQYVFDLLCTAGQTGSGVGYYT